MFGENYERKNKGDFLMKNDKKELFYKTMFPDYPDILSIN